MDFHEVALCILIIFFKIKLQHGAIMKEKGGLGLLLAYDTKLAGWLRDQQEFIDQQVKPHRNNQPSEPLAGYARLEMCHDSNELSSNENPSVDGGTLLGGKGGKVPVGRRRKLHRKPRPGKHGASTTPTPPEKSTTPHNPGKSDPIKRSSQNSTTTPPADPSSEEDNGILFIPEGNNAEPDPTPKEPAGKTTELPDKKNDKGDKPLVPEVVDEYYDYDTLGVEPEAAALKESKPTTEVEILKDEYVRTVINRKERQ